MSEELFDALASLYHGTTAFVGVGNTDRGDDGAGVALGRRLAAAGMPGVFEGGLTPEKLIPRLRDGGFDSIVFLDAVEAGAEPGAVVLLDASELKARFPQVSTHKLSLGTIAQLIADGRDCKVWLLGIQPATIEMSGAGLSPAVEGTVQMLAQGLTAVTTAAVGACQEQVCN